MASSGLTWVCVRVPGGASDGFENSHGAGALLCRRLRDESGRDVFEGSSRGLHDYRILDGGVGYRLPECLQGLDAVGTMHIDALLMQVREHDAAAPDGGVEQYTESHDATADIDNGLPPVLSGIDSPAEDDRSGKPQCERRRRAGSPQPSAATSHSCIGLVPKILGECRSTCFRRGRPGGIYRRIDGFSLSGCVFGRLIEYPLEVVAGLLGFARPGLQLARQHSSDCQPASDRFQGSCCFPL